MVSQGQGERNLDPGIKLVLEELRDLRVEMRADRAHANEEKRHSDERFARVMRDLHGALEDVHEALGDIHRAFKDIRTVGLSIVKTLNHHTRILERIDRKLTARGNGRP